MKIQLIYIFYVTCYFPGYLGYLPYPLRTDIPDICHFYTQARFLENKIYTEERVNYDKRISRQNSVNRDLLDQANNEDQAW